MAEVAEYAIEPNVWTHWHAPRAARGLYDLRESTRRLLDPGELPAYVDWIDRLPRTGQRIGPLCEAAMRLLDALGPLDVRALAGRLGVTSGSGQRLLGRLHDRGLVERVEVGDRQTPDEQRVTWRLAWR